MSDFSEWWAALSLPLKIYWAIAIPFTLLFVLQLLFSFLVGDVHHDATNPDTEIHTDGGIPFQFFTLKNLIAFFTLFGWTGIAAVDSGASQAGALIIAFIVGIATMFLMAGIMYFLSKATADGTMQFNKAIGRSGEVYLTIPSNRASHGKIQINVQGAVRTLDAVTDDDADIPTGKIITVTEVLHGNLLLVTAK